jgi:hypothetical protein
LILRSRAGVGKGRAHLWALGVRIMQAPILENRYCGQSIKGRMEADVLDISCTNNSASQGLMDRRFRHRHLLRRRRADNHEI